MLDFLWRVQKSASNDGRKFFAVMVHKSSKNKQSAFVPEFRCSDGAVIRKFGTRQIRQALQTSMAASSRGPKDGCIEVLVTFTLRN